MQRIDGIAMTGALLLSLLTHAAAVTWWPQWKPAPLPPARGTPVERMRVALVTPQPPAPAPVVETAPPPPPPRAVPKPERRREPARVQRPAVAQRAPAAAPVDADPKPVAPTPTLARAPAPAQLAAFDEERDRHEYLATLLARIERGKFYPARARREGTEGTVRVAFVLLADGSVRDVTVAGAGRPLRDAARAAVLEAAPFPAPPVHLDCPLPVRYEMQFRLR